MVFNFNKEQQGPGSRAPSGVQVQSAWSGGHFWFLDVQ